MAQALEYQTPTKRNPLTTWTPLTWSLAIAILEQLLIFGVYAPALDGGVHARMYACVAAGYWLVVAIIVFRRRHRPTTGDLTFIMVGYPAMVFPSILTV